MKNPHFFKAYSRIGLPNNPVNKSEANIGVEEAPDFILTSSFLKKFPDSKVSEFIFLKPEDIKKEDYWEILANSLKEFKDLINKSLERGETQVIIGGENSLTFSSLLADIERVKDVKKIGYIQFDSHGESNSFKNSPSKNFHGMYLRPFFDEFDIPEISSLVKEKLNAINALFIGNLDLDGDEPDFFKKMNFQNISKKDFLKNPQETLNFFQEFIHRFDHLHINFDVDVFDESEVQATGLPSKDGFLPNQILPFLELISKHPSFSFDLSEINPKKDGAKETITLAQRLLLIL